MLTHALPLDYTFNNPTTVYQSPHHHTRPHSSPTPPSSSATSWHGGRLEPPGKDEETSIVTKIEKKKNIVIIKPEAVSEAVHHAMQMLTPKDHSSEDDLKSLVDNQEKLQRCGYYHGSLSWADASHMLRRSKEGTYMVRDSEHSSYLFALSVQTRKGPTSCRLVYSMGSFRLDSAGHLVGKMPRFKCVTDLVEHYVVETERSRKYATSIKSHVWLDLNEQNTRDAPVQICKPFYKQVPDLQLLCCKTIVRKLRKRYSCMVLSRTMLEGDSEYQSLPKYLKNCLNEYLFPAHCL